MVDGKFVLQLSPSAMECIRDRVKDMTLPPITSWSGTVRGAKSG
jgi:hypothetical protein